MSFPSLKSGIVENPLKYSHFVQGNNYEGFSPTQLNNLILWLDGTDPLGTGIIPSNNSAVGTWVDKSGNGNNATQAVGANQPLFKLNSVNGLPAISFDGVNDQLQFNRIIENNWTIAVVFSATVAPSGACNTQWFCGTGLVDGEVGGVTNDFGLTLNDTLSVMGGVGSPDRTAIVNGNFKDGLQHLVIYTRAKTSGDINLYVDSTLSANNAGNSNTLNAPPRLVIGSLQTNIRYLGGYIAEIIICSIVLNSTNRGLLSNYLQTKWGTP